MFDFGKFKDLITVSDVQHNPFCPDIEYFKYSTSEEETRTEHWEFKESATKTNHTGVTIVLKSYKNTFASRMWFLFGGFNMSADKQNHFLLCINKIIQLGRITKHMDNSINPKISAYLRILAVNTIEYFISTFPIDGVFDEDQAEYYAFNLLMVYFRNKKMVSLVPTRTEPRLIGGAHTPRKLKRLSLDGPPIQLTVVEDKFYANIKAYTAAKNSIKSAWAGGHVEVVRKLAKGDHISYKQSITGSFEGIVEYTERDQEMEKISHFARLSTRGNNSQFGSGFYFYGDIPRFHNLVIDHFPVLQDIDHTDFENRKKKTTKALVSGQSFSTEHGTIPYTAVKIDILAQNRSDLFKQRALQASFSTLSAVHSAMKTRNHQSEGVRPVTVDGYCLWPLAFTSDMDSSHLFHSYFCLARRNNQPGKHDDWKVLKRTSSGKEFSTKDLDRYFFVAIPVNKINTGNDSYVSELLFTRNPQQGFKFESYIQYVNTFDSMQELDVDTNTSVRECIYEYSIGYSDAHPLVPQTLGLSQTPSVNNHDRPISRERLTIMRKHLQVQHSYYESYIQRLARLSAPDPSKLDRFTSVEDVLKARSKMTARYTKNIATSQRYISFIDTLLNDDASFNLMLSLVKTRDFGAYGSRMSFDEFTHLLREHENNLDC